MSKTSEKKRKPKLVAVESFCGAGGMALGLKRANFDVRLAFDNVAVNIRTHNLNLGSSGRVFDAFTLDATTILEITGVERGGIDCFAGGPPCQGFSKQRRGAAALADPRNRLVVEFARLVNDLQAKTFLFENVQIFGQKRGEALIEEMAQKLADYRIFCFHVSGADYGLAQARTRFLMIGIRADISTQEPVLKKSAKRITVRDVIADLPAPPEDFSEHELFPNHAKCKITKLNELRFSHVRQGHGWQDIPFELRLPCHQTADTSSGGWPDVYGRLAWDGQCPTITVGFDSFTRGRYGHPEQHRAITPREAARLQGFPDEFRFLGNKMEVRTQIGNAVPPPLAQAAGEAIARVLYGERISGGLIQAADFKLNCGQLGLDLAG